MLTLHNKVSCHHLVIAACILHNTMLMRCTNFKIIGQEAVLTSSKKTLFPHSDEIFLFILYALWLAGLVPLLHCTHIYKITWQYRMGLKISQRLWLLRSLTCLYLTSIGDHNKHRFGRNPGINPTKSRVLRANQYLSNQTPVCVLQVMLSVWSTWRASTCPCSCWEVEATPSGTWPAAGPMRRL